ncbi:MAG: S8 family peptidase [Weeksellaceae bacterium]|nr:S8 family peptidase [Weeksellaceae bacterium]
MKKMFLWVVLLVVGFAHAQFPVDDEEQMKAWYHRSFTTDGVYGVSSNEAYQYAASKGWKPSPIIVAVIDSGVDYLHEDLSGNMWKNPKEIPGNGIDDDGNGYIDDIYGWNFIGGADGKNVEADTMELTRLVAEGKAKFESGNTAQDQANRQKFANEYEDYQAMKNKFEEKLAEAKMIQSMIQGQIDGMMNAFNEFGNEYGMQKVITPDDLRDFQPQGQLAGAVKAHFMQAVGTEQAGEIFTNTPQEIIDEMKAEIEKDPGYQYYNTQVKYHYNLDFDPRHIVGDNYSDTSERKYGNNDVKGPDSSHGTHVAGIIGASFDNNLGMNGIARDVRIMSIRAVPDGDERDKDVANAIRYAADNGARIINMSFGKPYSPNSDVVFEAIKHATKKGVLLVHAAGNDDKDIDTEPNFPTNYNEGEKVSKSWITVGASTVDTEGIKASFSNFGRQQIDIFAPGEQIYSTYPENEYEFQQGTSMAAPVVSGVAALVWSFFPNLTAEQIRQVVVDSGNVHPHLAEISTQGRIVDALAALKLAENISKKK